MFNQILFSQTNPSLKSKGKSQYSEIIAFPSDHRRYKHLVLENGLRVFLIEDSRAAVSEAIMEVAAGSYHEPPKFPGLAHYLEHMLLQGTAKYKEIGEYQHFIKMHSGHYNAFTKSDTTEFEFHIEHDKFSEALDRFSQFFIAPLFDEDQSGRELEAVNQEFLRNLQTDGFRAIHVMKKLTNPKHPASKFSSGNLKTLPKEELTRIIPAMIAFYEAHYSADKMILVLSSRYPLLALEHFVRKFFTDIPKKQVKGSELIKELTFTAEELGLLIQIESVQQAKQLILDFTISERASAETDIALNYIKYILENESEGGMIYLLKQRGLIHDVSVIPSYLDKLQILLSLDCSLTEKGLSQIDEIVATIFSYISFLKNAGINPIIFKRMQARDMRTLTYNADSINSSRMFLHNIKDYPIKNAFVGVALIEGTIFPQEKIQFVLDGLIPSNLRLIA